MPRLLPFVCCTVSHHWLNLARNWLAKTRESATVILYKAEKEKGAEWIGEQTGDPRAQAQ